ncbi:CBO0543 family protein [Virgibacillus byunsanensis]|uniref:CBO0543 family protein n=1 Tax=Virgibacillus byunsanensis TaxID=570945 RepID=A0ABW3LP66_9BACI
MDRLLLWLLLIIGIGLLLFSLRKVLITDWVIIFLLTAYFSVFLGVLVQGNEMLDYPVRFLSAYFETSLLYEYLLLPVVCIYFYHSSYHSSYLMIVLQSALYTAILTILEVIFERYTNLIQYHKWSWMHTFISIFLLLIFIRFIMRLIRWKERNKNESRHY